MSAPDDDENKRAAAPPTSRFSRLLKLGALAPKTIPFAAEAVRRAFGAKRTEEEEAALQVKTLLTAKQTAEAMLKTLGEMKGLPLKFGQMASYIDGLAPPGYEAKFQEILKTLQSKAPPLSQEAARNIIQSEFGKPPEEVFKSFNLDAFAAASIGQVHRAVTHEGVEVAVKLQYPGIDKAIENDLKSIALLEQMIAPVGRRYQTKETLEEVRRVFMAELDYRNEADSADLFRRIHAGDDAIVIPRIYRQLSTRRVLTMELMDGADYATFVASASQAARNQAGETIWRFFFRALYRHAMLYADPHPGNYRFLPDGRIAFLDFGCTRELPAELLVGMKALVTTAMDGDTAGFERVCVDVYGYDPEDAAGYQLYVGYTKLLMQPFTQVPYHHTVEAARETVAYLVRNGRPLVVSEGGSLPKLPKPIKMPTENTFVNRLQWGLASIMGGLGAKGDYRAIAEPFIRGPHAPLP